MTGHRSRGWGHLADGRSEGVHTLELRPCDLQIFRGRHSLHRVKRVAADSQPRHAAIFAYTEQQGWLGECNALCNCSAESSPNTKPPSATASARTPSSTRPTRHLRGAFATNSIEINSKLVFGKERVDCA